MEGLGRDETPDSAWNVHFQAVNSNAEVVVRPERCFKLKLSR